MIKVMERCRPQQPRGTIRLTYRRPCSGESSYHDGCSRCGRSRQTAVEPAVSSSEYWRVSEGLQWVIVSATHTHTHTQLRSATGAGNTCSGCVSLFLHLLAGESQRYCVSVSVCRLPQIKKPHQGLMRQNRRRGGNSGNDNDDNNNNNEKKKTRLSKGRLRRVCGWEVKRLKRWRDGRSM